MRRNSSDVGDPLAVGATGREVAREQIGRDRLAVLAVSRTWLVPARTRCTQALRPHEAGDPVAAAADAVAAQRGGKTPAAIHPAARGKGRLGGPRPCGVGPRPRTACPAAPG